MPAQVWNTPLSNRIQAAVQKDATNADETQREFHRHR
jgi:hypothetical protein